MYNYNAFCTKQITLIYLLTFYYFLTILIVSLLIGTVFMSRIDKFLILFILFLTRFEDQCNWLLIMSIKNSYCNSNL